MTTLETLRNGLFAVFLLWQVQWVLLFAILHQMDKKIDKASGAGQ